VSKGRWTIPESVAGAHGKEVDVSRLRRAGRLRPFNHNIIALLALSATAYSVRRLLTGSPSPAEWPSGEDDIAASESTRTVGAFADTRRREEMLLHEDRFIFGDEPDGALTAARIDASETSDQDTMNVVATPGSRISIKIVTEDDSTPIAAFDLLVGTHVAP
jgi:hypothetical protein